MKFKIPKKEAIELGKQDRQVSKIELLGIEALAEKDEYVKKLLDSNIICQDNLFKNCVGPEYYTFYEATLSHKDSHKLSEFGIGQIIEEDGRVFLNRTNLLYVSYDGQNDTNNLRKKLNNLNCCEHDILTIKSFIPTSFQDLLFTDNCIITSTGLRSPDSVHIQEHSLVGRTNEDLESIPLSQVSEIIIEDIKQANKQLILQSNLLSVKGLQLRPVQGCPEKEGVMRYNKQNKSVEFFDGKYWNTLEHKRKDS